MNNHVRTFGNRIVWAERVDGLQILGNSITQTRDAPVLYPGTPMIDLTYCRDTTIEGNAYEGTNFHSISCDAASGGTLTARNNEGFHTRSRVE